MTLSISTLAAIQKVGAAAFSADAKLKAAAKDYAERVSAAITQSPDKKGTDALIENWRAVARLSQTLEGIEEELKKVYHIASRLAASNQSGVREVSPQAEPKRAASKIKKPVVNAVKSAAVAQPKVKAKASKGKSTTGAAKTLEPTSNPAKLFRHLEPVLNASEFTAISQTAVAKEIGIPLGSMTAAIKKLVETGRVVTGPNGSLKLTMAQPAMLPTLALPVDAI